MDGSKKNGWFAFACGCVGAALQYFSIWKNSTGPLAILSVLLMLYAFRGIRDSRLVLIPALLAAAAKFLMIHGAWDMGVGAEIGFSLLVSVPLIVSLLADRFFSGRLGTLAGSFVFPAVFVALDYLVTLAPVGMFFAFINTQTDELLIANTASLFGSWFSEFALLWLADAAVTCAAGCGAPVLRRRLGAAALAAALVLTGYSVLRQTAADTGAETVRVGSVTVEHPHDYWSITDAGTPDDETVAANKAEFRAVDDAVFSLSQKAADGGAKIVFWSEGEYPIYEDQLDDFTARASGFARSNGVYLMATPLVLRYGRTKNDNLCVMFGPDGAQLFRYEKTYSWYPTDSDGVIPSVETPYGTISAVICFDADFPQFLHQAARNGTDILLVPGFDTEAISPYHTKCSFLRGIENGFSVIRQANASTSMACSCTGEVLSKQDFFATQERLMVSDVPIRGSKTLYGITGEWFIHADFALVFAGVWILIVKKRRGKESAA